METNFTSHCCAYKENMKELLNQITAKKSTPTPEYFKRKHQILLTDIGGDWHLKNMQNTQPSTESKVQ